MADKLTVVARIKAKDGLAEQVKEELKALITPTRQEPDCLTYILHQSPDDPHLFLFFECWTSQAALEAHLQKPHLQAFIAKADSLLAEPLDVSLWNELA